MRVYITNHSIRQEDYILPLKIQHTLYVESQNVQNGKDLSLKKITNHF